MPEFGAGRTEWEAAMSAGMSRRSFMVLSGTGMAAFPAFLREALTGWINYVPPPTCCTTTL